MDSAAKTVYIFDHLNPIIHLETQLGQEILFGLSLEDTDDNQPEASS